VNFRNIHIEEQDWVMKKGNNKLNDFLKKNIINFFFDAILEFIFNIFFGKSNFIRPNSLQMKGITK
jgi:hypothetical protein